MFLALKENGFLFTQKSMQWYSPSSKRFLPDRYVEGTCYICGFEGCALRSMRQLRKRARAGEVDQPTFEGRRRARVTRDRTFLSRSFQTRAGSQEVPAGTRRPYACTCARANRLGKIEAEGLKPRPITRDLDWGVPIPVEGWTEAGKLIYVWFEAVIGYLSAPIEWSKLSAIRRDAWREWWVNPEAKQFHFIGKDNIFFHTSMWPAELMGAGDRILEDFCRRVESH